MIDSLKLKDETATGIVALAIEFETYSDELPESEKDRLEAAHEQVTFAIDSYKDDGIRADSDDEDTAEAGAQVEAILKVAGVSIDDDGDITYGKALTGVKLGKVLDKFGLELADEDEDEDEKPAKGKKDDDEAAFEIDDIIDGYEELSPASRIKAIKKLELDPDDDDDAAKLEAIADWEEEQDKPASRVINYIEELLGEEEGDEEDEDDKAADEDEDAAEEDDADAEEDEPWDETSLKELSKEDLAAVAGEFEVVFPKRLTEAGRKRTIAAILEAQGEAEGDEEGGDEDEPWEGYDETAVKDIKAGLTEAVDDEDEPLTAEQLQVVIDYEEANENRSSLLKWLGELLESLEEEDEPEAEEEPVVAKGSGKGKNIRARKRGKSADPDDSDDVDDAVAGDDEKESRNGGGAGKIILTRQDILLALEKGKVTLG